MERGSARQDGRLVVSWRGEVVMELPLEGIALGVGCGADNELRLSGHGIEPYHLVLRRRGRRWVALSRGQTRLTDARGRRVRQVVLAPDGRVELGDFSLEVIVVPGRETRAGTDTVAEARPAGRRPEMALRTICGPDTRRLRLGPRGATIGRDPTCDFVIDDPFMSLAHAHIVAAPGGWILADLGSRNGIRVDGRRVDGAEIGPGSRLLVGRTIVECVDPDPRVEITGGWIETPGLRDVVDEVARFATTSLPVLLTGESGVGKEGLARMLHHAGSRSRGPFVPVNCGALPESLADSILFGHVRGAFTGAHEQRPGLVQASSGGTLFLDEVGELSPAVQSRLLRVVEEGAVRPLGSNSTEDVDLRIVSATHQDLPLRVREGAFRLDLLHRLAVLTMEVPPLRRRTADIDVLARWLLDRGEVAASGISDEAMEILKAYPWPGNVRELRNVLCRAAMRSGGGVLLPAHLVFVGTGPVDVERRHGLPSTPAEATALLARASGNVARAARAIGVARSTLRDHLRRLGVERAVRPASSVHEG